MTRLSNDIFWPENLIEELAFNRAIIFSGAGVSATAINEDHESMHTWEDFIKLASKTLLANSTEQEIVKAFIKNGNLVRALEYVKRNSDIGAYTRFIENEYRRKHFMPSLAHKVLKMLDMKIQVTTNFDNVLEDYCKTDNGDYVAITYDRYEDILKHIKSYNNVIIKAHGTIDSPDKMIFTESEYLKSLKNEQLFYQILHSLFMTHTVLFIGYSMQDPDIQILLNSEANTASVTSPHYILVTNHGDKLEEDIWQEQYNIRTIKYGNSHDDFIPALISLYDRVQDFRSAHGLTPWIHDPIFQEEII